MARLPLAAMARLLASSELLAAVAAAIAAIVFRRPLPGFEDETDDEVDDVDLLEHESIEFFRLPQP